MKRLAALVLSAMLALALAVPAWAEEAEETLMVRPLGCEAEEDFDGDAVVEKAVLTTDVNEYGDGSFTFSVGDQSFTVEGCASLEDQVWALSTGDREYIYGTLFLVSEWGPSDDPLTYCFYYVGGELMDVGAIPAMAEYLEVKEGGIITAWVTIDLLGTWSRPADYTLASGHDWESEDDTAWYRMVELPRDLYPMGRIAKVKQALPLLPDRDADGEYTAWIQPDEPVVFTVTDGRCWVHASSMDGERAGWVRLRKVDWPLEVLINGEWTPENDVFSGLMYAG